MATLMDSTEVLWICERTLRGHHPSDLVGVKDLDHGRSYRTGIYYTPRQGGLSVVNGKACHLSRNCSLGRIGDFSRVRGSASDPLP